MRGLRRAREEEWDREDTVRSLRGLGCPMCRAGAEAERLWVTFYALENHTEPGVIAQVQASRGFCAAHTRALRNRPEAPALLTTTFADIVRAAAEHACVDSSAGCPVCDGVTRGEDRLAGRLARWWADEEVRAALRGDARVCRQHLTDVLTRCRPDRLSVVATDAVDVLTALDGTDLLAVLAGQRLDHARRQALIHALALQLDDRPDDPLAELVEDLRRDSCPTCRVQGLAAVRYLQWLAELPRAELERLDAFDVSLCADHSADLSVLSPDRATQIGHAHRRVLVGLLTTLRERAADLPPARLPRRIARATELIRPRREQPWRETAGRAAATLRHPRIPARSVVNRYRRGQLACPACRAGGRAAQRRTGLLAAVLDDPTVGTVLLDSHGPCLAHCADLSAHRPDPRITALIRTRLSILGWLLDEAARKKSWRTRHEPRGTEMQAWSRAPTWLTAGAYLGCDAMPEPDRTDGEHPVAAEAATARRASC